MKLRLDNKNDVLYLKLYESTIVDSEEVKPGIILDFDTNGNVVGVEMLGVSKHVSPAMLKNLYFETA